ncbi:histone-lysine N-methyltransferase SUVR3 [Impatiens glandulifera]|uniref:histone-lysine N-methyltransferase SUVR3 n=1 Tax=Impatiens glandulifera TaxID=253017 RepID=UPI001FB083FB|nr:histone-lysine N-methyltransferase SUVR3 [Impatiens glandulifera]
MEKKKERIDDSVLFHCADLILPWLEPSDLAAISLTCKSLNLISHSISASRSSDAARSFETHPIPFINTVDNHPYAYFIYTTTQVISIDSHQARQSWGGHRPSLEQANSSLCSDAPGCDCDSCDERMDCPCRESISPDLIRECGPSCGCNRNECGNRLTQTGVSVLLKIVKQIRKGWSLHSRQFIHKGQFVCEYAGELLTTKEARRRQENYDELASKSQFSAALLVIREHLPSGKACMRINIDATRIGNVGRFINHSCDGGNLSTVIVRCSGALLPRLCFFASRDIQEDEELSFSYGETRIRSNGLSCFCGSSCCSGTLPSENT